MAKIDDILRFFTEFVFMKVLKTVWNFWGFWARAPPDSYDKQDLDNWLLSLTLVETKLKNKETMTFMIIVLQGNDDFYDNCLAGKQSVELRIFGSFLYLSIECDSYLTR